MVDRGRHFQQANHCTYSLITLSERTSLSTLTTEAVLLWAGSTVQEEQNCSKKGMLLRTKHPDFMNSWGFYFKLALVWSIGLKAHEGQGVLLEYTFLFSVI